MIGKVKTGKSFRGCINYCLDKKQAQVLAYNYCYGEKKELIDQFNDLRNLNQKLSNPVQHMTLSLPPGEKLRDEQFTSLATDLAKEMGFEKNQYMVVRHHDTEHEHIHIIVNRVGRDGKTLSDSNNYKKLAEFCRKMEVKYELKKVLSPRKFQTPQQRQLPRLDMRKEKLKEDIKSTLKQCNNYEQFQGAMKQKGYQIEKARGIAFTDDKGVRIKGSEVGYSLATIEKILRHELLLEHTLLQEKTLYKEEHEKRQSLLLKKHPSLLLQKNSAKKESIADILTEKVDYQENVDHQYKKKNKQQNRLRL